MIGRAYMLIKKFLVLITTMCVFLVALSFSGVNTHADYTNILPTYTTNNNGTYPTHSWQSSDSNQTDVINHQGGTSTGWDNNTGWSGDPTDTTNSYIKYGTDTSNPDFAIRKYAKETDTPGLYDLYLNVRGNQQQDIKPIDIVLVVDMSGSMNSSVNGGTDRVGAVRRGINDFLTTIQNAGLSNYVNVGVVGFSSPGYVGGRYGPGYVKTDLGSVSDRHKNAINAMLNDDFGGEHLLSRESIKVPKCWLMILAVIRK